MGGGEHCQRESTHQVLIFLPPVSDAPERFKKTKKDKDMEMSGWIWHVGSNNG